MKVGGTGRGVRSAEVAARGSGTRALGRGCSWAGFFLSNGGGGSAPPAAASAAAAAAALGRLLLLLLLHRGPAAPGCSGFPALREWKLRKRKKKKITALPSARQPAQSLLSPPPRRCEAPQLRPSERRGRQAGAGLRGGARAASGLTPGRVRWRRGSVAPLTVRSAPARALPRSPPIRLYSAHTRGNAARLLETGGDLGGLWGWGSRS